jgi:glycosyltransferase involved in cell wall biosynthesis
MRNKVAIIGTVGIPAKYGGFESLVEYLTRYQEGGHEVIVYCSAKSYDVKLSEYNRAKLKYINLKANGVQSIPYDIISIFKSLSCSRTLLILGVSGCSVLPLVKLVSKNRILVNIDGLEWERAKWGPLAKRFLKYSEKIAVKYADVVIADNKVIQDYLMKAYGIHSELISYGADHVTRQEKDDKFLKNYPFVQGKYAMKVCRVEPENNIHLILEAFSMLPEKNFVCIGNWINSDYGNYLKKKFGIYENIFLLDPIYDQKLLDQFRSNCSIYIHGHSAGGTNPSLVEAMYLGLPIFAFGVNYNRETTGYSALYFSNVQELISLLRNVSEEQLKIVANDLQLIAVERYSWSYISNKYYNLFDN